MPNKEKLKQILKTISSSEEQGQLEELELQLNADKKLDMIVESIEKSFAASKESNVRVSKNIAESFESFVEKLGKKLEDLKGAVVQNKPQNAAGVYKDMINQLAAIDMSINKKPVPVWNWPQYAAVSVRDKNFSNIDPSLAYQHNTTTVAQPYGTTLAFNSAGTIKVVSAADPLPVDATVSATVESLGMAGLKVDIYKVGTTAVAVNTGNASNGTQRVVLASDQPDVGVDINQVTTSAFQGIRVFQQNSPSVEVSIASSAMSGLQVNQDQINGIAVSVGAGTVDTGTQRMTLGSNDPAVAALEIMDDWDESNRAAVNLIAGQVGVQGAAGASTALTQRVAIATDANAVNITAVTTSAYSGIRVYQQNSPQVTVASNTMNGLQVNVDQLNGVALSVGAGNVDTGTQRVTLASNQNSTWLAGLATTVKSGTVTLGAGSASIGILGANSGVDIGDVTLNNASIAVTQSGTWDEVGINDSGNSITVDLTTLTSAGLRVYVNNPTGAQAVPIQDGGNSITVDGTVNANITAATTSVLAGVYVHQRNDSPPLVTTSVIGITASTSGDNIAIGKQGTGKRIHVYAFSLSSAGTVNAKFNDGNTSKLLAGLFYNVANSGAANSVSPNLLLSTPEPVLFRTAANSNLYINLSGNVAVGGHISYYVL